MKEKSIAITQADYRKKAAEFAKLYQTEVSDHIIDIMASVMMTRDEFQIGGSFVMSVVRNNLYEALTRADLECQNNIKIIVLCNRYCFLNN